MRHRLKAGLERFLVSLRKRTTLDIFIGVVIAIAFSFLLMRFEHSDIPQLAPASVVENDVLAPADLKIEDAVETARRRDQAVASIQPVFDYVPRASKDARNSIERLFAVGRDQSLHGDRSALLSAIERESGLILDDEELAVFAKGRFSSDLEQLMIEHLESVTVNGVVSSRAQLVKVGALGIIRRDPKNNTEVVITDVLAIRDLITARAALRSDRTIWPGDYNSREQRLLGEVLGSLVSPNLIYNEAETDLRRASARETTPPVVVSVEKGQPIVVRGETVTPAKAELLKAALTSHSVGRVIVEFLGTVTIVTLLLLVLWQYMVRYQQRHLRVRRHFLLQMTVFALTLTITRLFFAGAGIMSQWATVLPFKSQLGYQYLTPLAVGAVLVTLLSDAHAAFVFSAILSVLVGVLSGNVYLAAYTLISSVGAIYHLKGCRDRSALIRAGLWIGLVNAAGALSLDFLGANSLDLRILLFDMLSGFGSGLLATMTASFLLPAYEWIFEIATDIKLLELSNLNLPLLKKLAENAPGTYHHSIMVGLLAEGAAEAIGGDALFARVACYYHDIGKVLRPTYFVENQSYLENRHDKLSPRMSSIVLANHVKQGIELARQHKLPSRIIAIIPQHHGTGLMKFFYYKAREEAGLIDAAALEQQFRYPGPKPQTREAAIIMIADSVEAAARTVKDPTPSKLRNMIDTIIARIRDDGQFDECNITMRELSLVADAFVKVLTGIYHHRIAYPGYDFNRMGVNALPEPGARVEKLSGSRFGQSHGG
ncbi:MAG TPA: HDIG domain-containing protein [Blastocatellia bacterium]|nr:HDIG domain-containing protein [Blastocatellia bacterium]